MMSAVGKFILFLLDIRVICGLAIFYTLAHILTYRRGLEVVAEKKAKRTPKPVARCRGNRISTINSDTINSINRHINC